MASLVEKTSTWEQRTISVHIQNLCPTFLSWVFAESSPQLTNKCTAENTQKGRGFHYSSPMQEQRTYSAEEVIEREWCYPARVPPGPLLAWGAYFERAWPQKCWNKNDCKPQSWWNTGRDHIFILLQVLQILSQVIYIPMLPLHRPQRNTPHCRLV